LLLVLFACVPGIVSATRQAGPQSPARLAGSEACAGCHPNHSALVSRTPHAGGAKSAQQVQGCEGCHGPGQAHIDAVFSGDLQSARERIFAFKGPSAENSARCLSCHGSGNQTRGFAHSEHHLQGVGCQSCHSAHPVDQGAGEAGRVAERAFFGTTGSRREEQRWLDGKLLGTRQPDLCYGCHAGVEAQFSLPTRHRVSEGAMQCSGCHNPHGSASKPMLRGAAWETCVGCHTEKRGPYVFEHPPMRVEGCVNCHEPHGSVNRNLLLRREGRFLCLQCHVDPFAANVPHGRLSFATRGECVRCHAAIHGSNTTPFFLD
jgi:predicted CXXCH cytochrome family protein